MAYSDFDIDDKNTIVIRAGNVASHYEAGNGSYFKGQGPEIPTRGFNLPAAKLVEWPDHVHTFLIDGSENVYYPPMDTSAYQTAAEEMGFPATTEGMMRYTVQHEIAHHLVAEDRPRSRTKPGDDSQRRWFHFGDESYAMSRIIYNACHNIPQSMEQQESKDEEHLVNRLQRFAMLGQPDPYGQLERVFGDALPALAKRLISVSMPWLSV